MLYLRVSFLAIARIRETYKKGRKAQHFRRFVSLLPIKQENFLNKKVRRRAKMQLLSAVAANHSEQQQPSYKCAMKDA